MIDAKERKISKPLYFLYVLFLDTKQKLILKLIVACKIKQPQFAPLRG